MADNCYRIRLFNTAGEIDCLTVPFSTKTDDLEDDGVILEVIAHSGWILRDGDTIRIEKGWTEDFE